MLAKNDTSKTKIPSSVTTVSAQEQDGKRFGCSINRIGHYTL
jgi:hypothetical protein